jgi:hypothetical protein
MDGLTRPELIGMGASKMEGEFSKITPLYYMEI